MADFLIALSDFDRRRGWEVLGYGNLFAFLTSELGLTPAPTYWRLEAARLLQRFPELIEPLRQGRLCLTTLGELSRVLTEENRAEVLPRFLGISSREAKEVVAELQPRPSPPMRTVIRPLSTGRTADAALVLATGSVLTTPTDPSCPQGGCDADTDSGSLWAPQVGSAATASAPALTPAAVASRRDEVDPLTAELSRLSTTVSRRFLQKLKTAREGLGHAIPRATTEQVLEAALDLLLEKQARARGQVKRPRAILPTAIPTPSAVDAVGEIRQGGNGMAPAALESRAIRRDGLRAAIPAAVKRAVWARDAGRCTWPLDGGGRCGSTQRLELDHIVPWADWGGEQEANLRVVCAAHNRLAARQAFGERVMGRYTGRRTRRAG
jgi:hypothetical protein